MLATSADHKLNTILLVARQMLNGAGNRGKHLLGPDRVFRLYIRPVEALGRQIQLLVSLSVVDDVSEPAVDVFRLLEGGVDEFHGRGHVFARASSVIPLHVLFEMRRHLTDAGLHLFELPAHQVPSSAVLHLKSPFTHREAPNNKIE